MGLNRTIHIYPMFLSQASDSFTDRNKKKLGMAEVTKTFWESEHQWRKMIVY